MPMRMHTETTKLHAPTVTDLPERDMLNRSHGSGSPTVTSKMFEPMELLTAISPWPCLATMKLDNRSGTEVPAAMIVSPDTSEGIPTVLLQTTVHSYRQSEKIAIHTNDRTNSTMASRQLPSFFGRRISGRVQYI